MQILLAASLLAAAVAGAQYTRTGHGTSLFVARSPCLQAYYNQLDQSQNELLSGRACPGPWHLPSSTTWRRLLRPATASDACAEVVDSLSQWIPREAAMATPVAGNRAYLFAVYLRSDDYSVWQSGAVQHGGSVQIQVEWASRPIPETADPSGVYGHVPAQSLLTCDLSAGTCSPNYALQQQLDYQVDYSSADAVNAALQVMRHLLSLHQINQDAVIQTLYVQYNGAWQDGAFAQLWVVRNWYSLSGYAAGALEGAAATVEPLSISGRIQLNGSASIQLNGKEYSVTAAANTTANSTGPLSAGQGAAPNAPPSISADEAVADAASSAGDAGLWGALPLAARVAAIVMAALCVLGVLGLAAHLIVRRHRRSPAAVARPAKMTKSQQDLLVGAPKPKPSAQQRQRSLISP